MANNYTPAPSGIAQYLYIIFDYLGIVTRSELDIKADCSQIIGQLWINVPIQQQPL